MGWLDDDGYLYLGDRMQDMILTGGANIYPAEVEAAIQEHPASQLGCGDRPARRGQGQRRPRHHRGRPASGSTRTSCARSSPSDSSRYKLPRTFEFVDTPLRDDAGKVRRAAATGRTTARLIDGNSTVRFIMNVTR